MRIRSARLVAVILPLLSRHALCQSISVVAGSMERSIEDLKKLDSLTIDFTLEYEHLSGDRLFMLNSAEVRYWQKKERMRLAMTGKRRKAPLLTKGEYAWDGKITTVNEHDYFTITRRLNFSVLQYNYYYNFLYLPLASGRIPALMKGKGVPPAVSKVAWLPDVVTKNRSKYTVRTLTDDEGVDCVVLEHPKHDVLWLDATKAYATRRRDVLDGTEGRLMVRTIMRDFERVSGVWLPKLVIREEFSETPDPSLAPETPVGRKTLKVKQFSTAFIPDAYFRLTAPDGATVHDETQPNIFKKKSLEAIAAAKRAEVRRPRRFPSRTSAWGAIPIAIGVILIVSIAVLVARYVLKIRNANA